LSIIGFKKFFGYREYGLKLKVYVQLTKQDLNHWYN